MLNKQIFICIFLFLSIPKIVHSQANIDSLIKISGSNAHDTIKTKALLQISWELKASDPDLALENGEKALDLSRKASHKINEANALKNIATIYLFSSNFSKSENYYSAAIKIYKSINDNKGLASCYNNLGLVSEHKGDFGIAMDYYQQSLLINEKIENKAGIASSQANIGNVLQLQGNYKSSIDYYLKALKTREELNEKLGIADTYNNIGALYEKQNAYSQSIKNYEKALMLYVEINEKRKSAMVLHNLGFIQSKQKKYDVAMDYYEKSLEIRRACGDKQGIASTLNNIGQIYYFTNKYEQAKKYFDSSYDIYLNTGNKYKALQTRIQISTIFNQTKEYLKTISQIEPLIKNEELLAEDLESAYEILSEAYFGINNLSKAYHYQELFIEIKDSLNNEENTKNILQLQLEYEFQKKQKEDQIIRERQRIHDEEETNKRKMIILILSICLIGFILIGILIYRGYLIKRQDNKTLEAQKKSIEEYNKKLLFFQEELLSQKEDLEVQKKMVVLQRDLLEDKNQRINESIHYAKRIQTLLLPPEANFKSLFTDYFILYKPKDIVSGDFYWLKETKNQILIAVADCTGHGVPGAFMSLLNMSFLNEIIESGVSNPAEILGTTREKIKKTLHYNTNINEPRDGMDIGICVIDKNTRVLQFSGAYHSLLILDPELDSENTLQEINGDKMPIGTHLKKEKPFTVHTHQIKENNKFFLFTDGFIDQFGGIYDRKFLPKKFKDIILKTKEEEMIGQKNILIENLDTWMDGREQIDDILVIGFQY